MTDGGLPMRRGKLAPWPFMHVSVAPKSPADQEKLTAGLARMNSGDPIYALVFDPGTGKTMLPAANALHLDVMIDMLTRICKVEADFGAPQIAYRETITRAAEIDHTYKNAGTGQFARVKLRFEPGEPDSGFVFASAVTDGAVPEAFIPGVIKGLEAACEKGLVAGYPLIDVKVTLIDGACHDAGSSVEAFEIAAMEAFVELRDRAGPILVEPMMLLEITVPNISMTAFLSDLKTRRGKVVNERSYADEKPRDYTSLDMVVPVTSLFGYSDVVRNLAKGGAAGILFQSYDHYAPVPEAVTPPAIGMRAQIKASIA